jgi:hypothetical protein
VIAEPVKIAHLAGDAWAASFDSWPFCAGYLPRARRDVGSEIVDICSASECVRFGRLRSDSGSIGHGRRHSRNWLQTPVRLGSAGLEFQNSAAKTSRQTLGLLRSSPTSIPLLELLELLELETGKPLRLKAPTPVPFLPAAGTTGDATGTLARPPVSTPCASCLRQ